MRGLDHIEYLPVSHSVTIYRVSGIKGGELQLESCGPAVAFWPIPHIWASPGMSAQEFSRRRDVLLRSGDCYFPAWRKFKHTKQSELLVTYQEWDRES